MPIVFAKNKNGRTVHVDSVPKGDDCGCFCPECGKPLMAVKGEIRLHHFRHKDEKTVLPCNHTDSPESILHYFAKEIIVKQKRIMACQVVYYNKKGKAEVLRGAEILEFESVEKEKEIKINNETYKPDLLCRTIEGEVVYIEINYTNRVKGNKFNAYNIAECRAIEIDISKQPELRTESDKLKFEKFLIESAKDRSWLSHPLLHKEKKRYEELEKKYVETQHKLIEDKNNNKEPKRKAHVDLRRKEIRKDNNSEKTELRFEKISAIRTSNELLSQLNDAQREAVMYNEGPSQVIAGAGSGKTRVLTYKIAYLLQLGMKPWNILALTFTNKAAREMKERIGKLVGMETAKRLNMGTFHSVFSHILRVEAELLGYHSNFTIYDETDSRSLLKSIIKELGYDEKQYKPSTVHNRISMAKNHLIDAEAYAIDRSALQRDVETRMPHVSQIFNAYQSRLQQANAMDFDDLLVNTFKLFRDHEDIRRKYAERFQFILVDEYQDTNKAQQTIVLQLANEHQHVCVVGDDAQSIYAFRGANIDNILDFQSHFNAARLFKLEQNYRSTQRIVQAANSLIKHNERQIHKDVYSRNDEGEKLIYKPAYSDKEEAMIVCNDILRIRRQEQCEYSDFAILYRTNAQSRTFEEEMRKKNIPYRIYGGLSFYQRKEIKDMIAYFRLVCNPDDEEAFRRILNYPARGIGNTTLQKIQECAAAFGVSLWEVLCNPDQYGLKVNSGTLAKLNGFQQLISSFIEKMPIADAYTLGMEIVKESGVSADIYSGKDPDDVSRQENLQEFISGIQDFVESNREEGREREIYLPDFLQEVALLTDLDSDDAEQSRVTLMTVHAAKGLEFQTVFIVGLEENIFPSQLSINSQRELEEERRLLYVAITRAEKHCILTNAKSRFRYGRLEFDSPSRFLADIDPALMLVEDESAGTSGNRQAKDYESNRPYTGSRPWGSEWREYGSRMQNSRPVASQFRADPQPKATSPRRPEQAVDPLSESFKRRIAMSGGNLRRVSDAIANGGRTTTSNPSQQGNGNAHTSSRGSGLSEGTVIEHQRFGIGTVIRIEGTGENTKATVEFRNAGTKQLLLKFARYTVVK